MQPQLQAARQYFDEGHTQSAESRIAALTKLRTSILSHEDAIYKALQADLRKSMEETWITETGFVLAEIRHTLKHLHRWMRPEKVKTNLINLPSRSFIYKEPLGVVLIIGPWNYPLQLLLTPLVGAIAAGNAVVLKPSEFAPATAAVMKTIIEESFDSRHVIYAEGDGKTVVPALMEQFRFDHIFYTGSTGVGRMIYEAAAKQLIPVTLELGGKSPCVVEADANIEVAAKRIALTKFSNAGQMCVAPDYVLVHQSIKEKFVNQMKKTVDSFFSADPLNSYHLGRIVNPRQFDRLIDALHDTNIVSGGRADRGQLMIEPTLVADLSPDHPLLQQEIFGPVLPLIPFASFDEGRDVILKNPDPLGFYVFTENRKLEEQWLRAIPFGGGCVNNAALQVTNMNLPFGGRGNSGIGAYHGRFSFDVFSHRKAVMKTPTWFDPSIKYPPYQGKLGWLKKIIG